MNYSENQWTPAELEFLQAHYGTAGEYKCRCWHVKGRHGDYKEVRPKDASCRYFIPLTASTSSGESY